MASDFTFANDDSQRFLPWHIGIMVALAAILLSLVIALGGWVGAHRHDYDHTLSVILPGSLDRLDEKTAQVRSVLSATPAIHSAKTVSESDMRRLLAPWIGQADALFDMALPVLLEATLEPKKKLDVVALERALAAIDPTIELEAASDWATVFQQFIRILQGLAVMLIATVIAAMTLMIAFSARASLHMHERTVSLLHGMGAEDGYIARQFQNAHFKIGLRASAVGALVAAAAYMALSQAIASINAPVLPRFEFAAAHFIMFALLPVICALVVLLATRYSVLAQLRKTL